MDNRIKLYEDKIETILIFGPPGAGKGTLGRLLEGAHFQKYVETGHIFRSLDPDSPAGKIYHEYASKKKLVPDEVTLDICKHYIQGLVACNRFFPSKEHLLLVGLPRTVVQAEAMLEWLDVKHVIVLECFNKENLRERLHRRARLEGKFIQITKKEFDETFNEYQKESEAILSLFPKHLISVIEAEQKPLLVLRDVLVRLGHILSSPRKS